ncbi:hypothetical protein DY000_02062571 [Brassica cretica]|uniref:Sinigrinase n=1 Tax=Brassica cretica TaxID=69181 RepID=A0ABQ7AUH3_BRACR|nr:hypothetical protein DY000_02062571 [Brassica cretica]
MVRNALENQKNDDGPLLQKTPQGRLPITQRLGPILISPNQSTAEANTSTQERVPATLRLGPINAVSEDTEVAVAPTVTKRRPGRPPGKKRPIVPSSPKLLIGQTSHGRGSVNPKGLQFYKNFILELVSHGNSSTEPYIVAHNLLLAHASASRLYRQKYKDTQGGSVGFSIFAIGFRPSTNSKDDEMAIQRFKDFFFGWMLGPLRYGDYPEGMKRIVGTRLPVFTKEESEQVKGSSDFVGVIHYLAASISNAQSQPSLPGDSAFFTDIGASLTYVMAVGNPVMQRMLSERRAALGLPVRDPQESDPTRQQPSNPTNYFEDM